MKGFIVLLIVVVIFTEAKNFHRENSARIRNQIIVKTISSSSDSSSSEEIVISKFNLNAFRNDQYWRNYKNFHQKQYKSDYEEALRYENYKLNDDRIQKHNERYEQGKSTYKMGHNQFSDMSEDEIEKMRPIFEVPSIDSNSSYFSSLRPAPESLSYQSSCLSVVNQAPCGACWAFAATAQVECQLKRKDSNFNTHISPQYLIDCAPNNGCSEGGLPYNALSYMYKNGIISTEKYPYVGKEQVCNVNLRKMSEKIAYVPNTIDLNRDEEHLKEILATHGPVVSWFFGPKSFSYYRSGVYSDDDCRSYCRGFNHAMVLIGYGRDDATSTDYWLLRNSYGPYWGEGGYIRVIRNSSRFENNCNVVCYADYAEV